MHTELAMLRAAGDYRIERAIHIDPDTVRHLPELTARGITKLARSGFTVTAVHAGDLEAAQEALAVLHAAAINQGHTVVWCAHASDCPTMPIDEERPALSLSDLHQQIARQGLEINSSTTIIVDCAARAEPALLTDLAEHAAENYARLILLDSDDRTRRPAPSRPLLKLLHRDLPWSTTLSTDTTTCEPRFRQPDLDPLLGQAEQCDTNLLPDDVTAALAKRGDLRRRHDATSRVAASIWRASESRHSDLAIEI